MYLLYDRCNLLVWLLTTVWKKGNMVVEGFMTCHWMRKNVTVDLYILFNAAVRDKDV